MGAVSHRTIIDENCCDVRHVAHYTAPLHQPYRWKEFEFMFEATFVLFVIFVVNEKNIHGQSNSEKTMKSLNKSSKVIETHKRCLPDMLPLHCH